MSKMSQSKNVQKEKKGAKDIAGSDRTGRQTSRNSDLKARVEEGEDSMTAASIPASGVLRRSSRSISASRKEAEDGKQPEVQEGASGGKKSAATSRSSSKEPPKTPRSTSKQQNSQLDGDSREGLLSAKERATQNFGSTEVLKGPSDSVNRDIGIAQTSASMENIDANDQEMESADMLIESVEKELQEGIADGVVEPTLAGDEHVVATQCLADLSAPVSTVHEEEKVQQEGGNAHLEDSREEDTVDGEASSDGSLAGMKVLRQSVEPVGSQSSSPEPSDVSAGSIEMGQEEGDEAMDGQGEPTEKVAAMQESRAKGPGPSAVPSTVLGETTSGHAPESQSLVGRITASDGQSEKDIEQQTVDEAVSHSHSEPVLEADRSIGLTNSIASEVRADQEHPDAVVHHGDVTDPDQLEENEMDADGAMRAVSSGCEEAALKEPAAPDMRMPMDEHTINILKQGPSPLIIQSQVIVGSGLLAREALPSVVTARSTGTAKEAEPQTSPELSDVGAGHEDQEASEDFGATQATQLVQYDMGDEGHDAGHEQEAQKAVQEEEQSENSEDDSVVPSGGDADFSFDAEADDMCGDSEGDAAVIKDTVRRGMRARFDGSHGEESHSQGNDTGRIPCCECIRL